LKVSSWRYARVARVVESAHASGVTDERAELEAMDALLARAPVRMIQTRTLNIDPELYFGKVGRPVEPLGMRHAI